MILYLIFYFSSKKTESRRESRKKKQQTREERVMYLVKTIAGGGEQGHQDGKGEEAKFNYSRGICVDDQKNVFVADWWNYCVRFISPDGMVSTLAGRPGKQ